MSSGVFLAMEAETSAMATCTAMPPGRVRRFDLIEIARGVVVDGGPYQVAEIFGAGI